MERVEALSIIMDMLIRVNTDDRDCPLTYDQAQKESDAQGVLYEMWAELGGKEGGG